MSAATNHEHTGKHASRHKELTNQLAAVLSVKPKRRLRAVSTANHGFEDDTRLNQNHLADYDDDAGDADDTIQTIAEALNPPRSPQTPPPLPPPLPAHAVSPATPNSTATNDTLVRSARRARFSNGTRQLASWAITITVTVFITGCVTVILLGLPQDMTLSTWNLTPAQQAADLAEPAAAKTAGNISK